MPAFDRLGAESSVDMLTNTCDFGTRAAHTLDLRQAKALLGELCACQRVSKRPLSLGTRAVIELIEELVQRGGGHGLFTGCAAGDTAMAVVLEVADRR